MPERASIPIQPRSTAVATTVSQFSPAATSTKAPPQVSPSVARPVVRTTTTRPAYPSSATTRLLPPPTTRTGWPCSSADRTASISSASSLASTSSVAGPPRRSVVSSASDCGEVSGTVTTLASRQTQKAAPARPGPLPRCAAGPRSAGLAVVGVLAATRAELLQLHAVRVVATVLLGDVVAFLAVHAGQGDLGADVRALAGHVRASS